MIWTPDAGQAYCVRESLTRPGFGMLADPGVGKTAVALTVAETLRQHAAMAGALVITPIRPRDNTWRQEGAKWDHLRALEFSVVGGTPPARLRALERPADVFLINPENLGWLADSKAAYEALAARCDVLIVDESHKFKNPGTERFRSLKKILRLFRRCLILTGTAATEGLEGLWSQMFILDRGQRLGRNITAFRERFMYWLPNHPGQPGDVGDTRYGEWRVQPGAKQAIYAAIEDIVARIRITGLKEPRQNLILVDLPSEARAAYRSMEKYYAVEIGASAVLARNSAGVQIKLRQMVNGAVYDMAGATTRVHDAKLEALRDLIEEQQGEPLMIVVAFQHDADRIREFLGVPIPYIGDGVKDSTAIVDRWNRKELPLLLVHPQSGGEGLNMQEGGCALCWFSLTWSLKDFIQMCARIRRKGQESQVIFHYLLMVGTVDEAVYSALQFKDGEQADFDNAMVAYLKGKL